MTRDKNATFYAASIYLQELHSSHKNILV